ncbi:hypothetical protein PU633_26480, partial [Kosakonia radicincitans]|nr:hypothetical protein [Kosakonia radicincitans]
MNDALNFPGATGAELETVRARLQRRRRVVNGIALAASLGAMAFGLIWLVWILYTTLHIGIGGLSLSLFTQ